MQAGVEFSLRETSTPLLASAQMCIEGWGGGIQTFLPPYREPDDPVMLPHQLPFHGTVVGSNRSYIDFEGGGRQPSLQPLLQEGQHFRGSSL